jgi:ABC-type lipoprotein release transport system permease subunit
MGQNVILKSLIRRPVIGFLLTLLIGLVSFGFIGKAVETIIVWRETNRLEGYYRSIGYITKDWEGEEHPYAEGAALIEQSPSVAFGDLRRQTAGFMHDYYNTDFDSGTMDVGETLYADASPWYGEGVNNLDYWFYGKLTHFEELISKEKPTVFTGYLLIFDVDQVLAGYPDRIQAGKKYAVWIPERYTTEFEQMEPHLKRMKVGQRYLMRAWSHPSFPFSTTMGGIANGESTFNLKALDGHDLWYIPIGDDEIIDLSLPQYQGMRLEIDRLNQNLRSILLIGTSDMSAMPEVQLDSKDYFLVEGRWLNRADEEQARPVIVISKNLAQNRGISLGDTIIITLRALKDPYHSYIRGEGDIRHWREYPNKTITYEVVGIYSYNYMESSKFSQNWFCDSFVPNRTFPGEVVLTQQWSAIKDKITLYSFVLANPRLQDAFIKEFTPKLKELGFDLTFAENNGRNFMAGADPLRKSTLIGSILFSAALLIAIALSVFLYLRQHRRSYAILRALGVPAPDGNKQLMLPLVGLGVIGSLVASILSWQNAHKRAAESLSKLPLPSGILPELTLHPMVGVGVWVLVLIILALMAAIGNRRVTRAPVLELLQDSTDKKHAADDASVIVHQGFDKGMLKNAIVAPAIGKADPNSALTKFYTSNILRSSLKSLLTVVVAAALLLALGWFQTMIKANRDEVSRLYQSSQVQIDFFIKQLDTSNRIPRRGVEWFMGTGIVDHNYLSTLVKVRNEVDSKTKVYRPLPPYIILAINRLDYGLERALSHTQITFLPGYGPSAFSEDLSVYKEGQLLPLCVPEEIMQEEGWVLGQTVTLECVGLKEQVPFRIIGSTKGGSRSYGVSTGVKNSVSYRFLITNLSGLHSFYSFLPDYFEAAFYTRPSMNYQLKAVKSELFEQQKKTRDFPVYIQVWDEELLAVVEPMEQNLSLMRRLYPVTLILDGVIGGVLCLLLILNQAKDTALLRMLGVEKYKIRRMQLAQILALSLIGLALGVVALIALRGSTAAGWQLGVPALIYLTGALLGTLAASLKVARKKPMEHLQVKE